MPFRRASNGAVEYACLRRADSGAWQGIAGGGEDDESPAAAARRESLEEAGIPRSTALYRLDAMCSIPTRCFAAARAWPSELLVIPEYAFAIECDDALRLSREHRQLHWGSYDEVREMLRWDSNRTALWELAERLRVGTLSARLVAEEA